MHSLKIFVEIHVVDEAAEACGFNLSLRRNAMVLRWWCRKEFETALLSAGGPDRQHYEADTF